MTTQQAPQTISTGFDFLVGSWDVSHRRFRDDTADEFRGTAAAWTYLDGAVSVEELSVPDRGFAGMALRIFDPETDAWSVHWISSGSGVIGDPVVGPVGPEGCRLVAVDDFEGAPLHSTYEWFGIERDLVHWRQQLSRDGQAWDLDWEMEFRRTDAEPRRQDLSYLPKVTGDFDFLDGTFRLHNRRLKERLTGCDEWIEFEHIVPCPHPPRWRRQHRRERDARLLHRADLPLLRRGRRRVGDPLDRQPHPDAR